MTDVLRAGVSSGVIAFRAASPRALGLRVKGIGATGAHYPVSKAGLLALARRTAAALAEYGATANAGAPGTLEATRRSMPPARIELAHAV